MHYLYLRTPAPSIATVATADRSPGEFKKEYPNAKLLAVTEVVKNKYNEGLVFDGGMLIIGHIFS